MRMRTVMMTTTMRMTVGSNCMPLIHGTEAFAVEDFAGDYDSDYDENVGTGEGMTEADPYAGEFH